MTDVDLSVDAIGKLSPSQLVELPVRLDPSSGTLQQIDVDVIGRAINPTKLRRGESAPFMTGKLKVRGDLSFAASLMSPFDLPRA